MIDRDDQRVEPAAQLDLDGVDQLQFPASPTRPGKERCKW